jgi:hypothetical protein
MEDFKVCIGTEAQREEFQNKCFQKGIWWNNERLPVSVKNMDTPFYFVRKRLITAGSITGATYFVNVSLQEFPFKAAMEYLDTLPDYTPPQPKPPEWFIDAHNSLTPIKALFWDRDKSDKDLRIFISINTTNDEYPMHTDSGDYKNIQHPVNGEVVSADDLKDMDLSDLRKWGES